MLDCQRFAVRALRKSAGQHRIPSSLHEHAQTVDPLTESSPSDNMLKRTTRPHCLLLPNPIQDNQETPAGFRKALRKRTTATSSFRHFMRTWFNMPSEQQVFAACSHCVCLLLCLCTMLHFLFPTYTPPTYPNASKWCCIPPEHHCTVCAPLPLSECSFSNGAFFVSKNGLVHWSTPRGNSC